MIKLKNLFKRKSQEDPRKLLKRIYKDKNGNLYYGWRDVRQLPGHRLRNAETAAVEADLSISAQRGMEIIDAAIGHFDEFAKSSKSQGFSKGLNLIMELRYLFAALLEEKTMLTLATVYYTMNDEDTEHYVQSEQQKKMDAWDKDEDAKDFFLCRAAEITGFFSGVSDKDILMCLKKEQPNLEKVARFFEKSLSKSTLTK